MNDGSGRPVGSIVQQNVFGKIRFGLEGQGVKYGEIRAENWRAWNFSIVDHTEQERARITKTWEGFAKTLFTTADDYLLELDPSISGDFRLLVLASAAGVDTALKQDSRASDRTCRIALENSWRDGQTAERSRTAKTCGKSSHSLVKKYQPP